MRRRPRLTPGNLRAAALRIYDVAEWGGRVAAEVHGTDQRRGERYSDRHEEEEEGEGQGSDSYEEEKEGEGQGSDSREEEKGEKEEGQGSDSHEEEKEKEEKGQGSDSHEEEKEEESPPLPAAPQTPAAMPTTRTRTRF